MAEKWGKIIHILEGEDMELEEAMRGRHVLPFLVLMAQIR